MTTTDHEIPPAPVDDRALHPSFWRHMTQTNASYIFVVNVVLFIGFTLLSSQHAFLSWLNATSMMSQGAEILLLSVGMTLMLSAGMFDLSLGANLILSSVLGAEVVLHVAPGHGAGLILLPLLVCVVAGVLFGLVNGLIIAYAQVNSLIATLGTLGIGTGVAYIFTSGSDLDQFPPGLQRFGTTVWAHVPLFTAISVVVCALLWVLLRFSRYGMRTLAIGSNRLAGERSGLNIRLHMTSLCVLTGALAGLAGFMDIATYGSTNVAGHTLDSLTALTAAVIGGTAISGGRASVIGTVWGAVLGILLLSGLVVIGLQSFYQQVATGAILIVAIGLDGVRARRRAP